ncbi:MAG: PEP/pyruvate-binding domain-containing protein [Chloroflexi bacterium]|nr:PEP/pyruvate-binding domain-containing protein [Chloroflexota bacterium]
MPNSKTRSYVVEFNDPQALNPSSVGSKAASVANLAGNGATIPQGFAIHARAFQEFIEPVSVEIENILANVDVNDAPSAFAAADSIRKMFDYLTLPANLGADIERRINSKSPALAVRFSATAEDLEDASFAGMYDTFLDATDASSVLHRVRDVWASYYTGRAISYRAHRGISHTDGSMAVLVMELVDAEAGGVVFTRDPRDGTDQLLINAALGLGEGVVSGQAQADSFTLDSHTFKIKSRNVVDKEWMIVSGKSGSTDRVPVPADKRSRPAISDSVIVKVATAAVSIKKAAGDDRDIEFAVKNDTVHILQSRPITTGTKTPTEFAVEWDNPGEAKLHWVPSFGASRGSRVPALPLHIDFQLLSAESQMRSVEYSASRQAKTYLKKVVHGHIYAAVPAYDEELWAARDMAHQRKSLRYLKKGTTYYGEIIEPRLKGRLAELDRIRPPRGATIHELIANLHATKQTAADHMQDLHWRGAGSFGDHGPKLMKLFAEVTGRPEMDAEGLLRGLDHMTARLVSR